MSNPGYVEQRMYVTMPCCNRQHGFNNGHLPATPVYCRCGKRWHIKNDLKGNWIFTAARSNKAEVR